MEALLVLQFLPEEDASLLVVCPCPEQSLTGEVTEGALRDGRRVCLEGRCAEFCS